MRLVQQFERCHCLSEKYYFPFDSLGSKTSLLNMLSIMCLFLTDEVGGEGVLPSNGRWTELESGIMLFAAARADSKLLSSATEGRFDKTTQLYNSLEGVTTFGLRFQSTARFCTDMSIAADSSDLAASVAAGSDLVTILICLGFSIWRPSLLSSSAIVPILRRLLWP